MAIISLYEPVADWSEQTCYTDHRGYVRVYLPQHPCCFGDGMVYEHRLVAERRLGRLLRSGEQVHHIGPKDNNNERNLFVCIETEHHKAHDKAHVY